MAKRKKDMPHVRLLERMGACRIAIQFARRFKSAQGAWSACDDIEWKCWFIMRMEKANAKAIREEAKENTTTAEFPFGCTCPICNSGTLRILKMFKKVPTA